MVGITDALRKIIPFLGIVLMVVVFQIFGDGKLLTRGNLNSILNQTVYVAIMAFGAVFVYSHGGMDLSYGGVIGFSVLISISQQYYCRPGLVSIKRSGIRIFKSVSIYHFIMYHVHVPWYFEYSMRVAKVQYSSIPVQLRQPGF